MTPNPSGPVSHAGHSFRDQRRRASSVEFVTSVVILFASRARVHPAINSSRPNPDHPHYADCTGDDLRPSLAAPAPSPHRATGATTPPPDTPTRHSDAPFKTRTRDARAHRKLLVATL